MKGKGIIVINVKDKRELKRHILSIHEDKYLSCERCSYITTRGPRLKEHTEAVHEDKRYECEKCSTKTTSQENLRRHIKYIHGERQWEMCDQCDFKTQGVKGINVHITTHGEKIKNNVHTRQLGRIL